MKCARTPRTRSESKAQGRIDHYLAEKMEEADKPAENNPGPSSGQDTAMEATQVAPEEPTDITVEIESNPAELEEMNVEQEERPRLAPMRSRHCRMGR